MKTVRIFISSPGDVRKERLIAEKILERLQTEFSGRLLIEPYFWEHIPMLFHSDPQTNIEPPSKFDLFICVLWSRLGTRLHPAIHRRPDGSEYASGTEFEVEDAIEAYRKNRTPTVLLYKRKDERKINPTQIEEAEEQLRQFRLLKEFLQKLTKDQDCFYRSTNSYSGLENFETKFESDLRELLSREVPRGVGGAIQPPKSWKKGSPFRGLRHFDFEDAPIFFGRTRATEEVIGALQRQAEAERAFVLVFGGSGVGKSSLVRAGVLPLLVRPGVIEDVGLWRRAIIRPGEATEGDLFDLLAAALVHSEGLPEVAEDGTTPMKLARMLRENPAGVSMLIKGALSQAASKLQMTDQLPKQPRALFALVLDQLEELFTIQRLSAQREAFLAGIDALARSGYVWVIATLRSDFYSRCEESPLLMQLKQERGQYHLQPPDPVAISQIIRLPASAAGVLFEQDTETGERLDDTLRDAAIKDPAALPLLEFALQELYEQRDQQTGMLRLKSYHDLGGVEGALRRRADQAFAELSAEGQDAFGRVFRHLVTIDAKEEQRLARRRVAKSIVSADRGSSELVDRLIGQRLLIAEGGESNDVVVTIVHEALLRSWPRLEAWVNDHREILKIRSQVIADVSRWNQNNRDSGYLYPAGSQLEKAKAAMETGFFTDEEAEFIRLSLAKWEQEAFWASLVTGEQIGEMSAKLRANYPELRIELLAEALKSTRANIRCNAAGVVGKERDIQLGPVLVDLLLKDPAEKVRHVAAGSLIQLDDRNLFAGILDSIGRNSDSSQSWRAAAELRAAANTSKCMTIFESVFQHLNTGSRLRVFLLGSLLQFRRGLPLVLFVLAPAVLFSCATAAGFKWLPALFNFALCQATPSAAMGLFHALTAAIVWGGSITFALAIYFIVFFREWKPRSYLRPGGAIFAGLISGAASSIIVLLTIVSVYTDKSLYLMGWGGGTSKLSAAFWNDFWFGNRFAWPYLLMGTSLGLGMALMTNGLRASERWSRLLREQTAVTGARQLRQLIAALIRLGLRFAWPVLLMLAIGSITAFAVLRTTPQAKLSELANASVASASDDKELRDQRIREWKLSATGQALGIAADALTQAIGGSFAIIGMGLGIIIARYGVRIEPQSNS